MDGTGHEACAVTQELSNLLVVIAADLARMRRHLGEEGQLDGELLAIDEAFAEPIALARKVCVAVPSWLEIPARHR